MKKYLKITNLKKKASTDLIRAFKIEIFEFQNYCSKKVGKNDPCDITGGDRGHSQKYFAKKKVA